MRSIGLGRTALVFGALAAAGCTSTAPQAWSIDDLAAGPNTARRGSVEFCRRYAAQTYAGTFELHKMASSDAWAQRQGRISGDVAYERCLSGRTS